MSNNKKMQYVDIGYSLTKDMMAWFKMHDIEIYSVQADFDNDTPPDCFSGLTVFFIAETNKDYVNLFKQTFKGLLR